MTSIDNALLDEIRMLRVSSPSATQISRLLDVLENSIYTSASLREKCERMELRNSRIFSKLLKMEKIANDNLEIEESDLYNNGTLPNRPVSPLVLQLRELLKEIENM